MLIVPCTMAVCTVTSLHMTTTYIPPLEYVCIYARVHVTNTFLPVMVVHTVAAMVWSNSVYPSRVTTLLCLTCKCAYINVAQHMRYV